MKLSNRAFSALFTKDIQVLHNIAARFWLILTLLALYAFPAQAAYEKATDLQASSILEPEFLKGENFTVKNPVKNDGLFNHYTVESEFGTFEAGSTFALKNLLNEINAIADMKNVETDDAALSSLKQSGANTVEGIKQLVSAPEETLEGAVSGIGGLFNRAKETVGRRKSGDTEDSSLEQLVGISKAKGRIASKYGVNVYSRNKVLQEELNRLGQADFLGGIGVGVATSFVPGVGGLVLSASGTARLLNEAINTTPASELWLQNKNKLIAMGMDEDTVELFLNNPSFSPALSTVLVAALESMKGVDNLDLFIKVALQSSDPTMASVLTRITTMTAGYHKNISPLKTVIPMARVTQGVREDGARITLMPVDHIVWNEEVATTASAESDDAKGAALEIWVLGSLSEQAAANFQKQGWKVHTRSGASLFPDRK